MVDKQTVIDGLVAGSCQGWMCNHCPAQEYMKYKRCAEKNSDGQIAPGGDFKFRHRVDRLLRNWVNGQE